MALSDWRHRRTEHGADEDRPPGYIPTSGIIIGLVFMLLLLWAFFGAYNGSDESTVTNAPAGTPPSTQQPDTTPPVNPTPAR